jgi:hypothetical protein
VLLGGTALLIAIGLTSPHATPGAPTKEFYDDGRLWQNVIDRIRAGDDYYTAMEKALRPGPHRPPDVVYALRPCWSFRLPTLALFLSALRYDVIGQSILAVLAILAAALWLVRLRGEVPFPCRAAAVLLLAPLIMMAMHKRYVFHDAWAGSLIALSLVLYGRNLALSLACGLLALFIREIAAPFVLAMAFCAWRENRTREVAGWSLGLAAFAIFYCLHAHWVAPHVRPDDPMKNSIAFGGWAFVTGTAEMNLLTVLGVPYVHAVLLPLGLLGAIAWRSPLGARITTTLVLFYGAFLIAGTPDNWYWGLLTLPAMAVGFAFAIPALVDLIVGDSGHPHT